MGRLMVPHVLVAVAALIVSALTLFSGFGLGTLLLPVFALFMSVEMAVAATSVVHGANNVLKLFVVGKHAERSLVLKVGIPAVLAAFAGAGLLGVVSRFGEILSYRIGNRDAVITPIKLVMALLMVAFALLELLPRLRDLKFDRKYLVLGGLLSGFFGGLSGHQGALRSAFLAKVGISKEGFVGTNAVIGFLVDLARIPIYLILLLKGRGSSEIDTSQWPLVVTGVAFAFAGVFLGSKLLHVVTLRTVQNLTGGLLLLIAIGLGTGVL